MLFVTALESAPLLTICRCTLKINKCLNFNAFCTFKTKCYGFKYPATLHPKTQSEKVDASLEHVIRHSAGWARNSSLSKEGTDILCNL